MQYSGMTARNCCRGTHVENRRPWSSKCHNTADRHAYAAYSAERGEQALLSFPTNECTRTPTDITVRASERRRRHRPRRSPSYYYCTSLARSLIRVVVQQITGSCSSTMLRYDARIFHTHLKLTRSQLDRPAYNLS